MSEWINPFGERFDAPLPEEESQPYSPPVPAAHFSVCEVCGERIDPGEMIVRDTEENFWIHEECAE